MPQQNFYSSKPFSNSGTALGNRPPLHSNDSVSSPSLMKNIGGGPLLIGMDTQ